MQLLTQSINFNDLNNSSFLWNGDIKTIHPEYISAENALRLTNKKFIKRFIYIENALEKSGKKFEDSSLVELDQIWNQAKDQE